MTRKRPTYPLKFMNAGSTAPSTGNATAPSGQKNFVTWPDGNTYSWKIGNRTYTNANGPCNENYLEYLAQNDWNVTMCIDLGTMYAIYDTSEDPAATQRKSNPAYAEVANYDILNQWYECYIAPLEDYNIDWRMYMAIADPCDIPWKLGPTGENYNGMTSWTTPATEAEAELRGWIDGNTPLNQAGNPLGRSYESLYGNFINYVEANYSKNFIEWCDELQYTNQARFMRGATNIWYVDSVTGYPVCGEYNPRPQYPSWPGALGGTTADCEVYNPPYTGTPVTDAANGVHVQTDLERLQMLDAVQFECYTTGMFRSTLQVQQEVASYVACGQLPSNFPMYQNYDTLYNINADGTEHPQPTETNWWLTTGVGEPNNRHWWETMASVQDMNFLREKRILWGLPGAFDAISWMQTGSMWPWVAAAHDMPWWFSQADQLCLTEDVEYYDIIAGVAV